MITTRINKKDDNDNDDDDDVTGGKSAIWLAEKSLGSTESTVWTRGSRWCVYVLWVRPRSRMVRLRVAFWENRGSFFLTSTQGSYTWSASCPGFVSDWGFPARCRDPDLPFAVFREMSYWGMWCSWRFEGARTGADQRFPLGGCGDVESSGRDYCVRSIPIMEDEDCASFRYSRRNGHPEGSP